MTTTFVAGQIRVTPEGYPLMPNKPAESTLSNNDTIMVQKADGIVRGIAVSDFKLLLPGGGSDGIWGSITGTLSDQTDLQIELDNKLESGDNVSELTNDVGYLLEGTNLQPITQDDFDLLTPTEKNEEDYLIVDEDSPGSFQEDVEDIIGTKVVAGMNVTVDYNDTTGETTISSDGGSAADGSETKINAGTNVSVTGSGTVGNPYVINSTDTNTQLSNEQVQDIAGAMWSGNTESGATVTYQDGDGTADITVSAGTGNIQNDAVTTAKIADASITLAKLNSSFYVNSSFTPTLIDEGGGATYTLSQAIGDYTRFGPVTVVKIFIETSGTTGTPTGTLIIGNVPSIPTAIGTVRMQGVTMLGGYSSSDILTHHLVARSDTSTEIVLLSDVHNPGIMTELENVVVSGAQIEITIVSTN